jgi:ferric-dicitrate binding protein FerR (iron transport regulator)
MNDNYPTSRQEGDGSPMDEVQMSELMMDAGYRPALPKEDLESIRAAAKIEWQELVDKQSTQPMKKSGHLLAVAASMILGVAATWWWISSISRIAPIFSQVVATIEVVAGGAIKGYSVGEKVVLGSTIETSNQIEGSPHRLALSLAGGASLRVDSSSKVVFNDEHEIELRAGGVYMDTGGEIGSSDPVAIITDFGVIHHVGTQYEVRLLDSDRAVRVRVREGRVSLRSETKFFSIESGEQLKLANDGREEKAKIPTHGPDWGWMTAAAPSIDIDGLPIRSYLEWLSRETGRTLIFETADVETYATGHKLGGTIEGLTPMESLEIVRSSTLLNIREQNGSILVFGPQ